MEHQEFPHIFAELQRSTAKKKSAYKKWQAVNLNLFVCFFNFINFYIFIYKFCFESNISRKIVVPMSLQMS